MSRIVKPVSRESEFAQFKRKAKICLAIAEKMLRKRPNDAMVEDQAVALVYLPDRELRDTLKRLNGDRPRCER